MDTTLLAIRAITATYAKRLLWLPLVVGTLVFIALLLLIGWIASSAGAGWWLLAVVPTFVYSVALTLWVVCRLLLTRLAPKMNSPQKKATKAFIKRIDTAAEHIGTSKFVLIYRMIKDTFSRTASSRTFIGELAQEPGEMRRAFNELRSLF